MSRSLGLDFLHAFMLELGAVCWLHRQPPSSVQTSRNPGPVLAAER